MFNANWSATIVKEARNRFHKNFTTRLIAYPLLYRRVNLGYGRKTQWEARVRAIARMKAKGHVVARAQQPLSR
jgi:hypothetical protein